MTPGGMGIAKLPATGSTFSAESTNNMPWLSVPIEIQLSFLRSNHAGRQRQSLGKFIRSKWQGLQLLLADGGGGAHALRRNIGGFPLNLDLLTDRANLQRSVQDSSPTGC